MLSVCLEKVLNLNHAPDDEASSNYNSSNIDGLHSTPILNADGDPIWKVLIFDDLGRDIISSVLRVNDLRAWGITIHLSGTSAVNVLLSPAADFW